MFIGFNNELINLDHVLGFAKDGHTFIVLSYTPENNRLFVFDSNKLRDQAFEAIRYALDNQYKIIDVSSVTVKGIGDK